MRIFCLVLVAMLINCNNVKDNSTKTMLTNCKVVRNDSLQFQDLMCLTELKAIQKYGKPDSSERFTLDDLQGEFRNGISDKFTPEERQKENILIDEITWEKDKDTWITVWYQIKGGKSIPKDIYIWNKGTEF